MAPTTDRRTDLALLLVRVVAGVSFLLHGLDKLGDLGGAEQAFAGLGIPAPELMAPFVALLEVVGGVALIAGVLAPLFALALAGDMLVAGLTAHAGGAFFVSDGGFELVLLLGVASLAITVAGAGRLSFDGLVGLAEKVPGYPGMTSRGVGSRTHAGRS